MCYNVHVRARNFGENSLNVVSCTFPHFSLKSILTPVVMSHNLVVETHFMTQFEHISSYVFLCAGTVLLPAISTARLHGAVFVRQPKNVDRDACQQSGLLENDRHHNEAQTEADVARSPSALRSLFAVILTMYEPSDSFQLWTAHQENLCEPLTRPTDGYFASIYI